MESLPEIMLHSVVRSRVSLDSRFVIGDFVSGCRVWTESCRDVEQCQNHRDPSDLRLIRLIWIVVRPDDYHFVESLFVAFLSNEQNQLEAKQRSESESLRSRSTRPRSLNNRFDKENKNKNLSSD